MAVPKPPIPVTRAPVLVLSRRVAGASALAKARRLGIIKETQGAGERRAQAADVKLRRQTAHLLGRDIPVLEYS
jgi:hypothetical protein